MADLSASTIYGKLKVTGEAIVSSLNGADIDNATSGDVPVSNGDGTLSMGTVESPLGWEEISGSPFTFDSSSTQFTVSLSNTYDYIYVIGKLDSNSNRTSVNITINGWDGNADNTNYYEVYKETYTNDREQVNLIPKHSKIFATKFSGKYRFADGTEYTGLFGSILSPMEIGSWTLKSDYIDNDVSSFTLHDGMHNGWSGKVRVFGMNI